MPCKDTKTGFASNAGMGPSGTLHIPHGASLQRSMSMGAPHQDPNTPNMGTLVAIQELRQHMNRLMQQQQRHLQYGFQRQGHNPPVLALEDWHPEERGMTRHVPVLDPALQQPRQGQEMTRHGPAIDPALQQPRQGVSLA